MIYSQYLKLYAALRGSRKKMMKFFVRIFARVVALKDFLFENKNKISSKWLMSSLQPCLARTKFFRGGIFLQNKTKIAIRVLFIFLVAFFVLKQTSLANLNLACLSVETEPTDLTLTLTLTSNKDCGLM